MTPLKAVTLWVRPKGEAPLPEARVLLEGLLATFYEAFPEYGGMLVFSQSPRLPCYVFVYVRQGCTGLYPSAGQFLQGLLQQAFPQAEVRAYGRVWQEVFNA
ncbi:hypothetical protein [Meiothermus hypogaeus]|uniref:Uncharacterized protein n=2 Tax=Meiothermus hypogaeus TaxID=884155 RepID=A0A511R5Q6_9DEIN|nr:hypothetical protein [Meiothermus hypogaeus]RIH80248.1 hypothetical protein Mhypo_00719 [Meiothermus hypogaeus]GEM84252.1 hypothetical protein MHY01S_24180 [Meiothermus hypogaeus NBRC 106114]GIW37556.1 MAG: hypothetical protein KatS3mg073_1701 [Meiothermus sp.]